MQLSYIPYCAQRLMIYRPETVVPSGSMGVECTSASACHRAVVGYYNTDIVPRPTSWSFQQVDVQVLHHHISAISGCETPARAALWTFGDLVCSQEQGYSSKSNFLG